MSDRTLPICPNWRIKLDVQLSHDLEAWVTPRPLKKCCEDTIRSHVVYNPMMLCQECQYLIKCFTSEPGFRNYLVFCASRGRRVYTANYQTYSVAIFRKQ